MRWLWRWYWRCASGLSRPVEARSLAIRARECAVLQPCSNHGISLGERRALLECIFRLENPEDLNHLEKALQEAGWDSPDGELVHLTRAPIITILNRYLKGELSIAHVESWANLVERREDILYGVAEDEKVVMDAVHQLANPVLEGILTPAKARALIEALAPA